MSKIDLNKFIKERREALLSLDKNKIVAYANKYGARLFINERVFWASIHKARLALDISEEEKDISRKWLIENGFKPQWNGYK